MGYEVVFYPPAQRYIERLKGISEDEARELFEAVVEALECDPFRSRPGADISPWKGPQYDYRLRVRRHRFGYRVAKREKTVHVLRGWFK